MAQKRHTMHSVPVHLDAPQVGRKLTQLYVEFGSNPDFSALDRGGAG
jgi:hypothetical protein